MAVTCIRCGKEIEHKNDLVVTSSLYTFYPYHTECFKLKHKKSGIFIAKKQINCLQGTLTPIAFLLIYLINLLFPSFRSEPILHLLWGILIVMTASERLYSYYKFEKKL
jgi:hypothetical protein